MSEEKINSVETGSSDEINSANPPVTPPKKSIFAKLIKWVFIFFLLEIERSTSTVCGFHFRSAERYNGAMLIENTFS